MQILEKKSILFRFHLYGEMDGIVVDIGIPVEIVSQPLLGEVRLHYVVYAVYHYLTT